MNVKVKTFFILGGVIILMITGCATISDPQGSSGTANVSKGAEDSQEVAKETPKKKTAEEEAREKIMKSYYSVTKFDGIDENEAIILAKSEVIFNGYFSKYFLEKPQIIYQDRKTWQIKFFPINKTLAEASVNPALIVDINRLNGKVRLTKEEKE